MFMHVVLGLLRTGKRPWAYGLRSLYKDRSLIDMQTGPFTRELKSLAKDGLALPVDRPPGADHRQLHYKITEAGIAEHERWLHQPLRLIADCQDDLFARTLFLEDLDPALALTLVEQWQDQILMKSKELERERQTLTSSSDDSSSSRFTILRLEVRQKRLSVDREFLEEARKECEQALRRPRRSPVASHEAPSPRQRVTNYLAEKLRKR
jgi:hypothetical protein